MLTLSVIKENPEEVIRRLAIKHFDGKEAINRVLELDKIRRASQAELDGKLAELKVLAAQTGQLMKAGKKEEEYKLYCKEHQIKYIEHTEFTEEIIADADILYMTRVQRERFTDLMEYERVKNVYILRNKMLENTRPNLRILHPLPRVNEIAYDVDDNPKAYYFQQAQNGLYAREAILCDVLGITLEDVKNDILL